MDKTFTYETRNIHNLFKKINFNTIVAQKVAGTKRKLKFLLFVFINLNILSINFELFFCKICDVNFICYD